ncbi:MAG TPA: anti-sigma factor [Flavobacterium sp.]|nr:anti-sigma factor [Flavobacterium sp.]
METREYIDSGILELYVYGLLSDDENLQVNRMAMNHKEINDEIISIEKAIINLSTSFSPFLSSENFEKIKERLSLKYTKVVEMKPRNNAPAYIGWAAAILLMAGAGYLYMQLTESNTQVVNAANEKTRLNDSIAKLGVKNHQAEVALEIVRDKNNIAVPLGGQTAAPDAFAKVYWNKDAQTVYVDAAGLPEPPEGKVYQVWALKLKPSLTPTSIGLLENFKGDNHKIFLVSNTGDAEAFGITLEPAGGSASPTMDQLYALGVVKV